MEEFYIRSFIPQDRDELFGIWDTCGVTDPYIDIKSSLQKKLSIQPDLLLVCEYESRVIGTVMAGYEGRRGWLNALGVLPEFRRRGIQT